MTRLFVLAAAMTGALASQPAFAESIAVSYADLNMASPAGHATLARRVSTAAHELCDMPGIRDLKFAAMSADCYRAAHSLGADRARRTQGAE